MCTWEKFQGQPCHPGGNPGANLQLPFKCYLREAAFEWELNKEIIFLPLSCLQVGVLPSL